VADDAAGTDGAADDGKVEGTAGDGPMVVMTSATAAAAVRPAPATPRRPR
jgi:hypothetical protein